MQRFSEGDRVRIDIPDETDPDHHYHGDHGTITVILADDAPDVTGDQRDSQLFRVKLESDQTIDVRWRSLRPPLEKE